MKQILILCLLFFSVALPAQHPPVNGYWEGTWGGGFPFSGYLETQQDGVAIKATITWYFNTDKTAPTQQAKEFLEGTYDSKTGLLMMHTVGEDDPENLIISGYYQLRLEPSGSVLTGFTTSSKDGGFKTPMRMSREGT